MEEKFDFLIVGAGLSGAVIAERLASQLGKKCMVIDKRNHIGGNCYDYTDENKIIIQKYGPHIFHTNNKEVLDYFCKFIQLNDYKHKVIAFYNGKYYPMPINLDTVNSFYNLNLKNEEELKKFLEKIKVDVKEIKNSEDVVISKFGNELYEAFVKNYTKKQWDKYPSELDRYVLERLPVRYDRNPYYYNHPFQGMPIGGFTKFFEKILNHPNIKLKLNTSFDEIKDKINYKILIYTGPIDEFFNYKFGKLQFRSINFVFEKHEKEEFQPNSVVNHTNIETDYLRVTEFKKFYDLKIKNTVICKEFFLWDGDPIYPVFNDENKQLFEKYKEESQKLKKVFFAGRLGTYKYLDMDVAIENSLKLFDEIKEKASHLF